MHVVSELWALCAMRKVAPMNLGDIALQAGLQDEANAAFMAAQKTFVDGAAEACASHVTTCEANEARDAAEIDRLTAQNEKLREVLKSIASAPDPAPFSWTSLVEAMQSMAHTALADAEWGAFEDALAEADEA
jgi:hypothetical protein